MLVKVVAIVIMLVILYSIGSGLYFLVTDKNDSDRVVKALTWRIGLSVLLFLLLMAAHWMGWLQPHTVGVNQHGV